MNESTYKVIIALIRALIIAIHLTHPTRRPDGSLAEVAPVFHFYCSTPDSPAPSICDIDSKPISYTRHITIPVMGSADGSAVLEKLLKDSRNLDLQDLHVRMYSQLFHTLSSAVYPYTVDGNY